MDGSGHGNFSSFRLLAATRVSLITALVATSILSLGVANSQPTQPHFIDVTKEAGLDYRNWFGDSYAKTLLETTGNGAAFCDFDNDGDLDVYLVTGPVGFDHPRIKPLPHDQEPPADGSEPRNGMFRNNGDGTFTDVSEASGTGHTGWGGGCVCGDYDNDGDRDLFIAYWGPNVLYRNEGDGSFTDVSSAAGIDDERYGLGGAFGDYDGDGFLDLFVTNYTEFSLDTAVLPGERRGNIYGAMRGIPSMAPPESHDPEEDILYRNRGDGTFEDVSRSSGVLKGNPQRGMGVVFWDVDNDGDQDIYVANDAGPNNLYVNTGNGSFEDLATVKEIAYDIDGVAEGSMGVATADFDNDGQLDLVVTNFEAQTTTVHRNHGDYFADISYESGVAAATLMALQWGVVAFDYDLDGDQDMYIASGHLSTALDNQYPLSSFAQRNQLFRNDGGRFADITSSAGPGMVQVRSSRGLAAGDYDGDGDEDLLVVNKNDLPSLLRNETESGHHWLSLRLQGSSGNKDGIGARVRVVTGQHTQTKEVGAGTSYLSHNSLWLTFGLGNSVAADSITVRWPGGLLQKFGQVTADCFLYLKEGGTLVVSATQQPPQ